MTTKSYIAIIVSIVLLVGLYGALTIFHPGQGQPEGLPPSPNPLGAKTWVCTIDATDIANHWNDILAKSPAPPIGAANAEYTLIEVGDFQCPQCGKIRPIIESLVGQSQGHAKLYFVNLPLRMHPHALFAANAAIAAARQGKFWQMYDVLYTHQDELVPDIIETSAKAAIPGFDSAKFEADLKSPSTVAEVRAEAAEVSSLRVQSTPTLFVKKAGGKPLWYVGMSDAPDSHTFGVEDIAISPPWANQ